MTTTYCPMCGKTVILDEDNACPNCSHRIVKDAHLLSFDEFVGTPERGTRKPPVLIAGVPLSHQAARASALTPFVLLLLGLLSFLAASPLRGTITGALALAALALFFAVAMLAGFALGIVGLVGGSTREESGTVILAVIGLALGSLMMVPCVLTAIL